MENPSCSESNVETLLTGLRSPPHNFRSIVLLVQFTLSLINKPLGDDDRSYFILVCVCIHPSVVVLCVVYVKCICVCVCVSPVSLCVTIAGVLTVWWSIHGLCNRCPRGHSQKRARARVDLWKGRVVEI